MKISCNKLKSYINNSEKIDWLSIWDTFTIRVAEVEGIELKGRGYENIVVGEIIEALPHPKKDKYNILKVDNGKKHLSILCGAPNCKKGMKVALVNVGGKVNDFEISEKEIAGVLSQGMLLSASELGIGDDHSGIIELPNDYVVGTNLKEILPLEDIIVEIDNKSLTNRPDLWGHYGIAREIAAITKQELKQIEIEEITNDKKDLNIKIFNENCNRYLGLKIDNIKENKSPLAMQIFLSYVGMRSLSLLVDLTNYVMLELGTPMHAFDSTNIDKIEIDVAHNNDTFITLDGIERTLSKDYLMIKNNDEYYAIAGVMGGLNSEVEENTSSIILESASFDATSVRKTATSLGLRTEASTRFEKSLDPNLNEIATKRFVKLLRDIDSNIQIVSNLTDVYPNKQNTIKLKLTKEKLTRYLGVTISDDEVKKILESLEFSLTVKKDYYEVIVPTFRATKDIEIEEDLIEEIARIYGYENINIEPLRVNLEAKMEEKDYDLSYELKKYLATKFSLNEVHTYLWNNTNLLKKLEVLENNVKVLGRVEDNVLRDDLLYSLVDVSIENAKYKNKFGIFEIGTVIKDNENYQDLGIMLINDDKYIKEAYFELKRIVLSIFKDFKNINVELLPIKLDTIYHEPLSLGIFINGEEIGSLGVIEKTIIKKKSILYAKIDFAKFSKIEKLDTIYEELSKYPSVTLDYTLVVPKDYNYQKVKEIIDKFNSPIFQKYEFAGLFETELDIKYTFRYTVGSYDHTLTSEELEEFKNLFIKYNKEHKINILE